MITYSTIVDTEKGSKQKNLKKKTTILVFPDPNPDPH